MVVLVFERNCKLNFKISNLRQASSNSKKLKHFTSWSRLESVLLRELKKGQIRNCTCTTVLDSKYYSKPSKILKKIVGISLWLTFSKFCTQLSWLDYYPSIKCFVYLSKRPFNKYVTVEGEGGGLRVP